MANLFCKLLFLNWPRRKSYSTDCFDILHSASPSGDHTVSFQEPPVPLSSGTKTRTWTRVTKALGTRLLCTINQLRQQCPFFHTVFCVIIINHAYFPASNIETNLMNYKNNYKKKEKKNIMISLATYRNVLANLFSPIFFQFWKRNLKKPKIPIPNERFSNLIR